MKRILAFGVLAAALLVPLAGCGRKDGGLAKTDSSASPSPSPTPEPAELLAAAAARLDGQNLKFSIDPGGGDEPVTASFDVATDRLSFSGKKDGSQLDVVVAGNNLYLTSPELKGKWAHVVVAKLSDDSGFLLVADPLFGRRLLAAANEVRLGAPGNFTGSADLTKVIADPGSPARRITDYFVKTAGDRATAIAFTAVVDAQNRLSEFHATFPGADKDSDFSYDFKITEVGGLVTIEVPAKSKVVETPAEAYKDL